MVSQTNFSAFSLRGNVGFYDFKIFWNFFDPGLFFGHTLTCMLEPWLLAWGKLGL